MRLATLCCGMFLLLGCEKGANTKEDVVLSEQTAQTFETIEWEALIPEQDLEAISNPPDYIVELADGSVEDQIGKSIESAMNQNQQVDNTYEEALISTNVIGAMDGKNIKIPGFVVPVEFISEQRVSSFFLVPYFGACLHMPPPPPNQIIYVTTTEGFELESLYEPVWISGEISTALFEDPIATSAYTMEMEKIELYYPDE